MRRRLLLSSLAVTLFTVVILAVPLAVMTMRYERERFTGAIEREAVVLAGFVLDDLRSGAATDMRGVADEFAVSTKGRILITNARGWSVADTESDALAPSRNFASRPEISAALDGQWVTGRRFSLTLSEGMAYVAIPVASNGNVYGAVRITYRSAELDRHVHRQWLAISLAASTALLLATLVGWLLSLWSSAPLRGLEETTDALAQGDLSARARTDNGPAEVRRLAKSFNQMAVRIDELVGSQRSFVADASHQLRTPLTALSLRLDQLRPYSDSSDHARDVLDAAAEETARLGRLVETMLALARVDGASQQRARIDVEKVLRERFDMWEPLATERQMRLTYTPPVNACAFSVPDALEQILDNFIANALDVSPDGAPIELWAGCLDEWVDVHVTDHGPGMSAIERERAFDRFWRGSSSRAGGSGLGLAIVRKLAVASGGEAFLRATPGGGVDAVVRLPRARSLTPSAIGMDSPNRYRVKL
ncbi:MAG: ATP-binding protein [Acidimicrobiia bacterium]